ncbi:hypothetical protein HKX48_001943, partial [Thoreauomyces humboldtii]
MAFYKDLNNKTTETGFNVQRALASGHDAQQQHRCCLSGTSCRPWQAQARFGAIPPSSDNDNSPDTEEGEISHSSPPYCEMASQPTRRYGTQ